MLADFTSNKENKDVGKQTCTRRSLDDRGQQPGEVVPGPVRVAEGSTVCH